MNGINNEPDGATPLEPDEMEGLIFKQVTTRAELNELEHANILEGMHWLNKNTKIDILNEGFILELHKQLFGKVWSWGGSFRRTEKNIGIDPLQVPIQLRQLLDDTRYWLEQNTYKPKELAARFHHKLVYIHLFPNGNGRHARIMADSILIKLMHEPAIDWSGGLNLDLMSQRRKQYIDALRSADKHDFKKLIKFVNA